MKKILLMLLILFVSVVTTACVNNLAVKELNSKADDYMVKGDTETAICRLKASLDLDSEVFETHYKLSVAYLSLSRYEECAEEIEKVIMLNPEYAASYYTLGLAKEALAYSIINNDIEQLTSDDLATFNTTAQQAVEAFNNYLIRDVKAVDKTEVNNKISALNSKIKEITKLHEEKQKVIQDIEVQEGTQFSEQVDEEQQSVNQENTDSFDSNSVEDSDNKSQEELVSE